MIKEFANRVFMKVFKKTFYKNYRKYCSSIKGKALLYFKTDVLAKPKLAKQYKHTNDWEILEILKILNLMGYSVDVIDRNIKAHHIQIKDEYDVFIGLGAGDSGKFFSQIASLCPSAIKIFFAAGPEPDLSNQYIKDRYSLHNSRNPDSKILLRRLITSVDISKAMSHTDVIFCIGNEFSINTYKKHNKDIYPIYPSSHPELMLTPEDLSYRRPNQVLYIGGSGNVVKGLDLLLETFVDLPDMHLHICAGKEEDFHSAYQKHLEDYANIHWHGFVQVGGDKFKEITRTCGFVALPSCSEGIATSVTTAMRRGLIPVVTYEAGIDTGSFGIMLDNLEINSLKNTFGKLAQYPHGKFIQNQIKSYQNSFSYTQSNFSSSFETALLQVLTKSGKLGCKHK
jgi:glycosyltransferase involved in cell wall biosynthesis